MHSSYAGTDGSDRTLLLGLLGALLVLDTLDPTISKIQQAKPHLAIAEFQIINLPQSHMLANK